ncbi:MAG: VanZ family protein [Bacteroidales bacterium]|nr:VanZ family protein [Bacteroidales bacterium]
MPLLQRLLHYSISSLLAIAILALLLWPTGELTAAPQFNDKLVHAGLFGLLALALWSEYSLRHPRGYWLRPLLLLTPCLVFFAGTSELLQAYLTQFGRMGDWGDFAADCVGIAAATPVGLLLLAWRKRVAQGLSKP